MGLILVVDDDERTVTLIRKILEFHGHKVITAFNGNEGLKRATKVTPDLIVADILMPDMDGLEMLKRIKNVRGETWTIPVIMLTGVDTQDAMRTAMESYAECYLTKPVNEASLMAVVDRVLAVKRPRPRPRGLLSSLREWLTKGEYR
jgi:CheY-like chemotaxis protein